MTQSHLQVHRRLKVLRPVEYVDTLANHGQLTRIIRKSILAKNFTAAEIVENYSVAKDI